MAATYAGQYGPQSIEYPDGGHALNTYIKVTNLDGTLATLYADRIRSSVVANPTRTDSLGNLTFFAEPGWYRVTSADLGQSITVMVPEDPFEPDTGLTDEEKDILADEVLQELEPPVDLVVLFNNQIA